MQYQIPPKPTQIIHPETNSKDPIHQKAVEAENFGGIFSFGPVGGTSVAASATVSNYTYSISYIPLTGPIPTEELKLQQMNKNMEQSVELRTR
jgi:hypothetical protein